jgi:uncharacterized protein (DUF1684 family)
MGIRLRDYESQMVNKLDSIPFFEINLHWRIIADFKPFDTPEKQKVQTVIGVEAENTIPGELSFTLDGEKLKLYPVAGEGEWSIVADLQPAMKPIRWAVSRHHVPDSNNKVVIDFNKAYNPPVHLRLCYLSLSHRSNMQ